MIEWEILDKNYDVSEILDKNYDVKAKRPFGIVFSHIILLSKLQVSLIFLCNLPCAIMWDAFQNTYDLLNLRALKFSVVNKIHIFQCMGNIFWAPFEIPHKISLSYNIEILSYYI